MIVIGYPPGAGGRWLSSLIKCLINNRPWANKLKNFHGSIDPAGFRFNHNMLNVSGHFCGNSSFNIFINQVIKSDQFGSIENETIRLTEYGDVANYILNFRNCTPDLNFDLLFTDRNEFIESLYNFLTLHSITFNKNDKLCNDAIDNYITTCADPKDFFDNWDNEVWLGWCKGVLRFTDNTDYVDMPTDKLKKYLLPRQEFLKEFTLSKIIFL